MNPPDENEESSTDEILDWYLPEKTGVSQRFPYQQSASQKPSHFQTMIQKLHIGTTLAALILFFLPWIDIQCSQQSIATQTGIQAIYGAGSPSKEMQAFMDEESQTKSSGDESDESMGFAPLIALALLAVIGAVFLAFIALRSDEPILTTMVGILCAIALVLISAQMVIGFPAKASLGKAMGEGARTEASASPMDDFGSDMAAAMMMQFQIRHLPSLYITLVMLGFPTLILANGLLDKLKKPSSEESAPRKPGIGKSSEP